MSVSFRPRPNSWPSEVTWAVHGEILYQDAVRQADLSKVTQVKAKLWRAGYEGSAEIRIESSDGNAHLSSVSRNANALELHHAPMRRFSADLVALIEHLSPTAMFRSAPDQQWIYHEDSASNIIQALLADATTSRRVSFKPTSSVWADPVTWSVHGKVLSKDGIEQVDLAQVFAVTVNVRGSLMTGSAELSIRSDSGHARIVSSTSNVKNVHLHSEPMREFSADLVDLIELWSPDAHFQLRGDTDFGVHNVAASTVSHALRASDR